MSLVIIHQPPGTPETDLQIKKMDIITFPISEQYCKNENINRTSVDDFPDVGDFCSGGAETGGTTPVSAASGDSNCRPRAVWMSMNL